MRNRKELRLFPVRLSFRRQVSDKGAIVAPPSWLVRGWSYVDVLLSGRDVQSCCTSRV